MLCAMHPFMCANRYYHCLIVCIGMFCNCEIGLSSVYVTKITNSNEKYEENKKHQHWVYAMWRVKGQNELTDTVGTFNFSILCDVTVVEILFSAIHYCSHGYLSKSKNDIRSISIMDCIYINIEQLEAPLRTFTQRNHTPSQYRTQRFVVLTMREKRRC